MFVFNILPTSSPLYNYVSIFIFSHTLLYNSFKAKSLRTKIIQKYSLHCRMKFFPTNLNYCNENNDRYYAAEI